MIVELFGLPGSGKTTLAKSFVEEGAVLIPAAGRLDMVEESLLFSILHPVRAVQLFVFIATHAPREHRTLLLENLFFAATAKYMRAWHVSREGGVAVIDQGYFQSLLSLFGRAPDDAVLAELVRILPKPDLLLALETPHEERIARVAKRGRALRANAGETIFPRALALFTKERVAHAVVAGSAETKLIPLLTEHISYVTHARMPTEKAHGVSIAHMCAAFADASRKVLLIVPRRENRISKDIFSFYGVPHRFAVRTVPIKDFFAKGLTHPFFFFLQRISFLFAVKNASVPTGIVYTREPEVAWKFSGTHLTVFEAHNWPKGFWGWLQAQLVFRAELVVCNSRGTETAAHEYGITHTIVAPNGFDPNLFASAPKKTRAELGLPEGVLALYAGSDKPGKGAGVARAAGRRLNTEGVSIVLIGTKEKNIEHSRVPEYLLSADILLLPNTREGESEYFTSPIKLFEYLAAGKAIIASDLPSIREILGEHDALFVPPGDAQALAHAVERLAADPILRARLSARAKELSGSYSWNKRAERILEGILL